MDLSNNIQQVLLQRKSSAWVRRLRIAELPSPLNTEETPSEQSRRSLNQVSKLVLGPSTLAVTISSPTEQSRGHKRRNRRRSDNWNPKRRKTHLVSPPSHKSEEPHTACFRHGGREEERWRRNTTRETAIPELRSDSDGSSTKPVRDLDPDGWLARLGSGSAVLKRSFRAMDLDEPPETRVCLRGLRFKKPFRFAVEKERCHPELRNWSVTNT